MTGGTPMRVGFRAKFRIFIGLILFSVFICFTTSLLLFFLFFTQRPEYSENVLKKFDYQYTEINLFDHNTKSHNSGHSDISSSSNRYGISSLPISIDQEEHISYLNEDSGSSIIITNFGGSNYECIGSCYCSPKNIKSRRFSSSSSANLLTRGLTILFSAFSTTMASKIAKETFDQQCTLEFESICLSQNTNNDDVAILSEVESCSEKEFENINPNSQEEVNGPKYLCQGHCIVHRAKEGGTLYHTTFFQEFMQLGSRHFGNCENLFVEREIEYNENLRFEVAGIELSTDSERDWLSKVKLNFAAGPLNDYCTHVTRMKSEWFSPPVQLQLNEFVARAQEQWGGKENEVGVPTGTEEGEEFVHGLQPFCVGVIVTSGDPNQMMDQEFGQRKVRSDLSNVKCVRLNDPMTFQE